MYSTGEVMQGEYVQYRKGQGRADTLSIAENRLAGFNTEETEYYTFLWIE